MATPCQKPRVILANSSALSRLFDSPTYHTSGVAIEQFGQRAIMVVPPNPNSTKTISSALRQCGQQSAWSSLITPTRQPPEPDIPDYNVFPIIALFFCSVANL